MPAPALIHELVARFERNIDQYKRSQNETQVRREFIDPFFKELGWDIDNSQGAAPQYQDVVHEDQLKISGSLKAPDYAFRIGGQRKFYVEAKKPSVVVKDDPSPALQVRTYAWNAKLDLSIVTDFEEFAVYECSSRPKKNDKPSVGRINYFTYKDYIEKWDEIAGVFSKDAIIKGSFDKYAAGSKGKRGTQTVDKEFLAEIEGWREKLARSFAKNNKITEEELKFATQRTLDRIIFLRICEARRIEEEGRLKSAAASANAYKNLFSLFQAADNRYNSGLFHFRKGDKAHTSDSELDTITPKLKIEDKVLREIVDGLYYPSPYLFDVIPADILGQVYEQFLGKVIRLTPGGIVKIEEKPEVRKAGGVYYTPTYIVDYIVKNTVGTMLEEQKKEKPTLKILDPACGSGSFLLGAYNYLLEWYTNKYAANPDHYLKQKIAPIYQHSSGSYALTTPERKRILLEHIYGVDIDAQAVEVAKLNLMLKCLEGEAEAEKNLKLQLDRILPDLSDNIKCGNSLIGSDFFEEELFASDVNKKINPFDWESEYPNIMKKGGFDVVVGNPPYVRQEILGQEFKDYVSNKYQTYHGSADLYAYFIERGINLLKKDGRFSFIVANKWMRAKYGEPLRKWLKQQRIEEIVDFGDLQVFRGATTYPCILTISKAKPLHVFNAINIQSLDFVDLSSVSNQNRFDVPYSSLRNEGWSLANSLVYDLLEKIKANKVSLGEYVGDHIYRGILTGLNEAFIIDEQTKARLVAEDSRSDEIIKPILAGKDIKRYQNPSAKKHIIVIPSGWTHKRLGGNKNGFKVLQEFYPAVARHLIQFEKKAQARYDKGDYWWELRSCDYYPEFEKPKLMLPDISLRGNFLYDSEGKYYSLNTTYIISTDEKTLMGILNSRLITFFYAKLSSSYNGGYYRFIYQYLVQIPIKTLSKPEQQSFDALVERMLELNKELSQATTPQSRTQLERQIARTDSEIDRLVYELYGLTEEEIRIVEGELVEQVEADA